MVSRLSLGADVFRCGHCKNLAPGYTKAAEHMAGIFTFAAVDCDDQSNRALCQEFDVKGFPTIKFMKPFQGKLDVRGNERLDLKTDSVDYNGPRTAKGLTDFAKENMENLVVRVTDDNLSSFLGNNVWLFAC
jgi:protein disulfide-isomerase A6